MPGRDDQEPAGTWARAAARPVGPPGPAPSAELSGAAIIWNGTPKTVPAALLKSTIESVLHSSDGPRRQTAGVVSASVTVIAEGVLRAMLLTKIKTMIALTLAAGVTVAGLGLLARGATDGPSRSIARD